MIHSKLRIIFAQRLYLNDFNDIADYNKASLIALWVVVL